MDRLELAAWAEEMAALNYRLELTPGEPVVATVTGIGGTDRDGETHTYRLDGDETLEHLRRRMLWERSWDGYEPIADYVARCPEPV